jgi:hypothetical protein
MFLWYWSVTHLMEFLSQRYTHRILQTSVAVKDSCYVPEIQYGYIECLVKLSASDIYHGNLVKSWKKYINILEKTTGLVQAPVKITHFTVVEMFSTLPHTPYMQIITPCMQVTPFPILTIYATPFLIHNSSFTIYFFLQSL